MVNINLISAQARVLRNSTASGVELNDQKSISM